MSALFTESGCPLELLLPTTSSTCKRKKTYITRLLRELNVLKVGQNREISSFLRFLRFLTNFIIMYYGQHFLKLDMKHSPSNKVSPWQLILSSKGPRAVQEFQIKLPRFGDFKFCALKKRLSLKLNISIKIRDNQLLRYIFSKLI